MTKFLGHKIKAAFYGILRQIFGVAKTFCRGTVIWNIDESA